MNSSKRGWALAGLLIASLIAPGEAWANSKFINVQGRLTDTAGTPLTGTQTVTFRLYTSSFAAVGSAIWTESQSVALSSGLFNVKLGSVTALDSLPFTLAYFLGIQVAGDANELSPRQQLGASAYAQGSLGDFNVGSNLGVVGSVTASSVSLSGNAGVGGSLGVNGSVTASSASLSGSAGVGGSVTVGGQGTIAGTMTIQGNAFSVGGSTFAVSAGSVGIRTASPITALDVAGSAQFGGSAMKSTFTATPGGTTYALTLSSGAKLSGGPLELSSGGFILWPDGTKSTTAARGDAVLNATQTFSGANTFRNMDSLAYGSPAGPNPLNVIQDAVWATSVDGASQSSGCVVVVKADGNGVGALIVFTSTTTVATRANSKGVFGVLLETCAPGAICRVGTRGFYRVQNYPGELTTGYTAQLATTRCTTGPNGADDGYTVGYPLAPTSIPANNWYWIYLKN